MTIALGSINAEDMIAPKSLWYDPEFRIAVQYFNLSLKFSDN